MWPDNINPLRDPDIAAEDRSQVAWKKHLGHSIRVLNAWWKAAHYIQNQDNTSFCMHLLTQTIRSSGTTYTWPANVVAIRIDARGVTTPIDNPKITFEYVQSFQPPIFTTTQNREVTVRSFTIGGAPPPGKAVKRLRGNEQAATTKRRTDSNANENDLPFASIEDLMTPAHTNSRGSALTIKPTNMRAESNEAGTSSMGSPTATPLPGTAPTPTRELTNFYGDANPPPSTPQTMHAAHIQVTHSGRRLPAQGPRDGSRNAGVEQHE